MKNNKGVTLVELLVVIVVMGIIAGFAIPAVGNIIENANQDNVVNDAIQVENAAKLYCSTSNDTGVCDGTTLVNLQAAGTTAATEIASFIEGIDLTAFTHAAVQRGTDGEWYVYLENATYFYGSAQVADAAAVTDGINDAAPGTEGAIPSVGAGRANVTKK